MILTFVMAVLIELTLYYYMVTDRAKIEIPSPQLSCLKRQDKRHDLNIQQNGTYIIKRFKVANSKDYYRPVHAI
ncbi:unnamed protein product, partial [Urochloa humidicola]